MFHDKLSARHLIAMGPGDYETLVAFWTRNAAREAVNKFLDNREPVARLIGIPLTPPANSK